MTYKQVKYFLFIMIILLFSVEVNASKPLEQDDRPKQSIASQTKYDDDLASYMQNLMKIDSDQTVPSGWSEIFVAISKPIGFTLSFHKPNNQGGKPRSFVQQSERIEIRKGVTKEVVSANGRTEEADSPFYHNTKTVRISVDDRSFGFVAFRLHVQGLTSGDFLRIRAYEEVPETKVNISLNGKSILTDKDVTKKSTEYPLIWDQVKPSGRVNKL